MLKEEVIYFRYVSIHNRLRSKGKRPPLAVGRTTVNLQALQHASSLLEASNSSPSTSSPSVLRPTANAARGSPVFATLPSTEQIKDASLGLKPTASSSGSKHDPWSVSSGPPPMQPALVRPPSQQIPIRPMQPTQANDQSGMFAPAAKEALSKAQLQQQEAQLALQRAQQDIKMAHEQAKQAAQIQEQTKRAKEQEAQSAAALAQAQETARQAAIMKEQAENALRAAQAGIVQSAPPPMPPPTMPSRPPPSYPAMRPMTAQQASFTGMPSQPPTSQGGFNQQMPGIAKANSMPNQFSGMQMGGMNHQMAAMNPQIGGMQPQRMPMRPPASRPLPPPLIPTNTAKNFVPVGGIRPPMMPTGQGSYGRPPATSGFGGQPSFSTQQASSPANSSDPYAAFKSVDAHAPSIFSQPNTQPPGIQPFY